MKVYELIINSAPQGVFSSKAKAGEYLIDQLLKSKDENLLGWVCAYEQEVL